MQNYYKSYDKDIISIRGGGKVSKGDAIKIKNPEQTIISKLKKDTNYMPPLFKITDRENPIDVNAYVNSNNYVVKDGNIQDYYYSAQQINNMNIIDDKKSKSKRDLLNKENPIKSPPPLVKTYPEGQLELTEEEMREQILKKKIREKIREQVLKKLKQEMLKKEMEKNIKIENDIKKGISQKEKEEEFKIIKENFGKSLWISENNMYTVKSKQDNKLPWKKKEFILNLNDGEKRKIKNDIKEKEEKIENFSSEENKSSDSKKLNIDYSIIVFVAVIIIIIIIGYITLRNQK